MQVIRNKYKNASDPNRKFRTLEDQSRDGNSDALPFLLFTALMPRLIPLSFPEETGRPSRNVFAYALEPLPNIEKMKSHTISQFSLRPPPLRLSSKNLCCNSSQLTQHDHLVQWQSLAREVHLKLCLHTTTRARVRIFWIFENQDLSATKGSNSHETRTQFEEDNLWQYRANVP